MRNQDDPGLAPVEELAQQHADHPGIGGPQTEPAPCLGVVVAEAAHVDADDRRGRPAPGVLEPRLDPPGQGLPRLPRVELEGQVHSGAVSLGIEQLSKANLLD